VKIIKGIGHGCDKEVIVLINSTHFTPAEKGGKKMSWTIVIPIKFELSK